MPERRAAKEGVPPPVKPMVVNELPLLGYLEQAVALTVTKSLTATGLKKPKHPLSFQNDD